MDIDNFGLINTNHGQHLADEILKKFGIFLKSDSRATDSIYRQHLKGDEFIIIARDTILDNALKAAIRKRDLIANTGIQILGYDAQFRLTVCCGIAELNANDDLDSLIERAHVAMKQAKTVMGQNNCVTLI